MQKLFLYSPLFRMHTDSNLVVVTPDVKIESLNWSVLHFLWFCPVTHITKIDINTITILTFITPTFYTRSPKKENPLPLKKLQIPDRKFNHMFIYGHRATIRVPIVLQYFLCNFVSHSTLFGNDRSTNKLKIISLR